MNADSAWKKFESTGMISDYLNYRMQLQSENETFQSDLLNISPFQGVKDENRRDWNNNIGKKLDGR